MLGLTLATACVASAPSGPRTPVASSKAAAVLGNVQRFYANANQLRAQFHEVVKTARSSAAQTSEGTLLVSKPDDVRFDYLVRNGNRSALAVTKTVIFDGSTLWTINHGTRQIVQRQSPTGGVVPAAVSFLTGGPTLQTHFTASLNTSGSYGTRNSTVLELVPKQQDASYKQLFFVVDSSDWHVSESIVVESNGDTSEFRFYAPNFKQAVNNSLFQVSPGSLPNYQRVVQTPQAGGASAGLASAGTTP